MKIPPWRRLCRIVLIVAGVALAYFVTGRLLLVLSAPPNGAVTTVWLPSGITVAALVLCGPWAAVGSFFGSLALDLKMNTPLPAALLVGLANAGSELLCYYLVAARGGRGFSIVGIRDGGRLVSAAAVASVLSASIGVSAYVAFGVLPAAVYGVSWLTWFGSTAIGIVLITPFLVYAVRERPPLGPRARQLEFLAALAVLALAAFLWQGPGFSRDADDPVVLVIIVGLLWIAFRFPPAAMTLAVFSFAVGAVGGAVLRLGQQAASDAFAAIFALQLMLGGLAIIGYLLAAMVAEQQRANEALRTAQSDLLLTARAAGMAEIATDVLHNVGNVLNSVNISVGLVSSQVRDSKVAGLAQAVRLIQAHAADLGHFLSHDEQGKHLPGYLDKLAGVLAVEQQNLVEEMAQLSKSVEHLKEIVATQQLYAGAARMVEPTRLRDLIEDALRMNGDALAKHEVTVLRDFPELPELPLDRHRVLQILVNLISNARQAMDGAGPHRLTLGAALVDGAAGRRLRLSVTDDGEGIAAENLTRIFAHGFTTRPHGHGFGLHSCVLAAQEMGGTLSAHSDGPGRGATFTLELPV